MARKTPEERREDDAEREGMALDEAAEILSEIGADDMKIDTLAGDLRDALLTRVQQMKRPWSMLTEDEQRDLVEGLGMMSRELVRQTVRLFDEWEWPHTVVRLGEIKIVGGDKARIEGKVTAANIEHNRNVLGDHVNDFVMLVCVDSEAFMGERAEPQIDPDQPELPGGDEGDQDEAA